MTNGLEQLRHELMRLDETLQAFEAPVVDELPGLRLMRRTLQDRRSQVADKVRDVERCQVIVALDEIGRPDDGVPAELLADVLTALQTSLRSLARELTDSWEPPLDAAVVAGEVTLWLVDWDAGNPPTATLHFLRSPEEQLVDAETHQSLLERLLETFATAVDAGRAGEALSPLATIIIDRAVRLQVTTVVSGGASREVPLDRRSAQRILRAGGDTHG